MEDKEMVVCEENSRPGNLGDGDILSDEKELVWKWAMLGDAKTGIVSVKELGGCLQRVKRKSQEKYSNKVYIRHVWSLREVEVAK